MKNNNKCKPMKHFTSGKSYILDDQTIVWCPKSKLNPKHVCKEERISHFKSKARKKKFEEK